MALNTARRGWVGAVMLAVAAAVAFRVAAAQMPIGSVSTVDATVYGASSEANDRAQLGKNGTVIAKGHAAFVQLLRGGSVKVCATSGVHLTAGTPAAAPEAAATSGTGTGATGATAASDSGTAAAVTSSSDPGVSPADQATPAAATTGAWAANKPPPLMVAMDRGAMELRMGAVPGDEVITPDLRVSFTGDGQLDVRIRVGNNGDTCIENRVAGWSGHPGLAVGSLFGTDTYNVMPGQHVLFEGGNLREVVDNESSPCGCPEEAVKPPPPALGDISLKKSAKVTGDQAAVQHPFPADVSQGLAPPPPVPQAPPQVTHTQVATTLVYNGGGAPDAAAKKDDSPTTPPEQKKGFFHSVGRFFKRVF